MLSKSVTPNSSLILLKVFSQDLLDLKVFKLTTEHGI